MGMFDTITVLGDDSENMIRCASAHILHEFQTKDLECSLKNYYIHNGVLYEEDVNTKPEKEVIQESVRKPIKLVLRRSTALTRVAFTRIITVYTSCDQCDPVVYECESAFNNDKIGTRQPWVEVSLHFDDGKLVEVAHVRVQDRGSLKKELAKNGVIVLPDNDRVAKKVIQQWHKR